MDSKNTKIPYSNLEEEQILVINQSNNRSTSPLPQTRYVCSRDVTHTDSVTIANHPGWRTGTKLICHHCYAPGHISSECNLPMNKIQEVVANYENHTQVPNKNYEFTNKLVPGRPEHLLANEDKEAQPKK